jgi:hypothetical protein
VQATALIENSLKKYLNGNLKRLLAAAVQRGNQWPSPRANRY